MKKILFLVAVIFTFQAAPVFAQSKTMPSVKTNPEDVEMQEEKKLKPLNGDTDGDGMISKEEYLKSAEERFDVMDQTKDGKLSREEIRAAHIKKKAKMEQRKAQNKVNKEYYDKRMEQETNKLKGVTKTITK